jgi:hypothetical protein
VGQVVLSSAWVVRISAEKYVAVEAKKGMGTYQSLARGMNGEFAQVTDDPLALQLFRYGGYSAGTAEKVGHKVAFSAARLNDPLQKYFGLLCRVRNRISFLNVEIYSGFQTIFGRPSPMR